MARTTDPEILIPQATGGDRRALARMITLVEDHHPDGDRILAELFPQTGEAWTTGLTGAPGAGKSTLTNRLISEIRATESSVAVLAVDPSSPFTGGAVLGDRVRMQDHIDDGEVYIRSMASRGHLGGVSEATPRAMAVLDGMGFPEILVETVGVGQAEVEIAANADTTLVVLNPGWGDSIQAAKAGLLEIGDVFVVNKADRAGVNETMRDLKQMLELGGHGEWWPPVIATVASSGQGIAELWEAVAAHRSHLEASGELGAMRHRRLLGDVETAVAAAVRRQVRATLDHPEWEAMLTQVTERRLDPWTAARRLLAFVAAE
jgi:LAO/AO transport system kinase